MWGPGIFSVHRGSTELLWTPNLRGAENRIPEAPILERSVGHQVSLASHGAWLQLLAICISKLKLEVLITYLDRE